MIINYTSKRSHRPDVLGPNLVTNPGPFNNTTGWSAGNSATLSVVLGNLRVARNVVDNPYARQTVTIEPGELYLFEADYVFGTSAQVAFLLVDAVSIFSVGFSASGSVEKLFKLSGTTLTIDLYGYTTVGTNYGSYSKLSLRKVTSLGHRDNNIVRMSFSETFCNATSPWSASSSTISVVNNKLQITNVGAVAGNAYDVIKTIPGCSYSVSFLYTEGTCTAGSLLVNEIYSGTNLLSISSPTTGTVYTGSFVATTTESTLILQNSSELNAYNAYSMISVRRSDSSYTLEKGLASESDERPSIGGWRQISIGGNAESNYGRKDEIHTVTTKPILSKSEADDWKEFFDSCAGGELFTIDLYQDPRSELITSGTFDTATTGWAGSAATLSVSSRKLRVTNSGAAAGDARLSFSTTAGVQYTYYVDNTLGTAAYSFIQVGTSAGASDILSDAMTVSKTYKNTFVATSATTHLRLLNNSTTSAQYTDFDNVSVKSIATDNVVSAILEGDGKIDRISQHIYSATFSYRVI